MSKYECVSGINDWIEPELTKQDDIRLRLSILLPNSSIAQMQLHTHVSGDTYLSKDNAKALAKAILELTGE